MEMYVVVLWCWDMLGLRSISDIISRILDRILLLLLLLLLLRCDVIFLSLIWIWSSMITLCFHPGQFF